MTQSDIQALMRGIAPVIRSFVDDAVKPLAARLDAIEKGNISVETMREKFHARK